MVATDVKKLNSTHLTMAYLAALGKRPQEIAKQVGYTYQRVIVLMNGPLFKAQVRELQEELKERSFADLAERLNAGALPTLDSLVKMRDGGTKEDTVRLGAARTLWESLPPIARGKREAAGDDNRSVHIHLDMSDMKELDDASREYYGPEVKEVVEFRHDTQPRSIDDVLEKMGEDQ